MPLPHVIIIGGGFGGLQAAIALRNVPVQVTLIDQRNHHLFQPLLYQVATGGLSAANISSPLRVIVQKQKHTRVLMERVQSIDVQHREVVTDNSRMGYDTLIVAAGSTPNYFGKDEWRKIAPTLKSIENAVNIRNRILSAFEQAELETEPDQQRKWMTFVIVGGGPTGVELAGAIGELKAQTLKGSFRRIDPASAQVILIDAGERILATFPAELAAKAMRTLGRLGITVHNQTMATDVHENGLTAKRKDGTTFEMAAKTILWTAGVKASPLGEQIAQDAGAETDRDGRIFVQPDLSIQGHPEILIVGDIGHFKGADGRPLPALAPVAMQQGRYAAKLIEARLQNRTLAPFVYNDRGNLATVGRGNAVVDLKWIKFSGFFGWLTWLFVHLLYIVQFENRFLILIQWSWNYFTHGRSARLIADQTHEPESHGHL